MYTTDGRQDIIWSLSSIKLSLPKDEVDSTADRPPLSVPYHYLAQEAFIHIFASGRTQISTFIPNMSLVFKFFILVLLPLMVLAAPLRRSPMEFALKRSASQNGQMFARLDFDEILNELRFGSASIFSSGIDSIDLKGRSRLVKRSK
ncbi:hypothetical protein BC835DRAFT_1517861 [Cytidiella melzeri]|nr:hypothetical protein BC835DRAFT_1517861 [Cytidiella melzeri]